jgi:ADP-ribose pyrophosphatase YjhB (NUDIX family)
MADVDRIRIYRFCPRCGAEAMSVRGPQLVVCAACGLHLYYNPCAATAAILLDAAGRVLLVRRAKDPAKGKLAFPGGFIDNDESAEDGLRRELREEVGLEVGQLEFLVSHPNSYPYGGVVYPTLDFFFVAHVPDFGRAEALDGVEGLVVAQVADVRLEDLAFTSMRAAWTAFLERRAKPG